MNGVDTNVLLRFILRDDPEQAAKADAFLESACTREDPCFINRIVLCELVWVLERGHRYPRQMIAEALKKVLRTEEFLIENGDEAWAALSSYRASEADFADCLLGKVNRALGCALTATFDVSAGRLEEFLLLGGGRRRGP